MIIHHVRVMTKPGLQAGAHHHLRLVVIRMPAARSLSLAIGRMLALSVFSASVLQAQATFSAARYRVSSTSVLSLDRAPGETALVDTVVTTSLVTVGISSAIDTIATLTIDSLQLTSTGMIRRAADAFSRGISVSATLQDGRPSVTGDSASACSAERPLAGLLPELLPLLPTPLRAEQQWSDTVTVTTCRSGLTVTTVTIATYRTLTGMDSSSVLLERRAVIRAAGSAIIRNQAVTLTGTGTSASLGVVALGLRQLQSWRATQSLDFQLTNGTQARRMVQQITDTATLQP